MKNLVYGNARSGNKQVQAFKEIIQESVYPKYPENFSSSGMAIAVRTFEAYKRSCCDQEGLIDLMLFFVECGTQFTLDYGDIDEDFYNLLEDVFEDTLILIKNSDTTILERYQGRIYSITQETGDIGWGYTDQIQDLLDLHFPNFLKNNSSEKHI